MEVLDGDPFSFCLPVEIKAAKDLQGKLEVGESLPEGSDELLDFEIHPHVFLDVIS